MTTRSCTDCGEERSVAGVWYLVDADEGEFVCGGCYEPELTTGPH